MERPHVICHILSALNGRITGPFMGASSAMPAVGAYGKIREELAGDAWLYGTTTTKEFTSFQKPELKNAAEKNAAKNVPPEPEDFAAAHKENFYYISVDTQGEVGWEENTMSRGGKDAHIVEVLTGNAPQSYRAYLREKGISYIQAGEKELDCRLALEKLYRMFGIRRLIICGGGMIDWIFLHQGMMDELSLVLAPAAAGGKGASVFDSYEDSDWVHAAEFALKKAETLDGGAVHLMYKVL